MIAHHASGDTPAPEGACSPTATGHAGVRRFLLLACSQRKCGSAAPIPAIELYDGPTFRLLRRYLRADPSAADLEVRILSAQHGLLTACDRVAPYDRRLTGERAAQIGAETRAALTRLLSARCFAAIHVEVGQAYAPLVPDPQSLRALAPSVTFGAGSVGQRLAQMHDWLFGAPPALAKAGSRGERAPTASLRGVPLPFGREEIFEMGRRALADGRGDPHAYHAWFVDLDGVRVSPKWLVGQLSGLAPAAFHSADARRVLTLLGVPVERV